MKCFGAGPLLLCYFGVLMPAWAAPGPAGNVPPPEEMVINRGAQISTAVAAVTSTAVSPLLGVCVLGVYDYVSTPKAERSKLPAYERPVFWIPVGILLLLILIKDTVGGFAPMIKKPLDAVEVLLLNKASLILIGFPVVFHQVAKIIGADSIAQILAMVSPSRVWVYLEPAVFAAEPVATTAVVTVQSSSALHSTGNIALTAFMLSLGLIAMVAVWMVSHAIDVLILLSPFPFLDLLLKGCRSAIFVLIAGTSLVNRTAGLVLSLIIIVVSLLMAGWAFRIVVFGVLIASDMLRAMAFGIRRVPQAGDDISGFAMAKSLGLAKRSFGKVRSMPDGSLEFRSRRFGVGPTRVIGLGTPTEYEVGRGLIQPSLVMLNEKGDNHRIAFLLLPCYRGSEEQLRSVLGVPSVRDTRIPRGLRAFWNWLNADGPILEPKR